MSLTPSRPRHHLGLVAAALLAVAATTQAQDIKLPQSITMTAYDTGSSGFNMAVAIGKMMKEKHGTDVRVLPGGQRHRAPGAAARRPRAGLGHGGRRLLRPGGRVRVRRSRTGARSRCS
jgi:hypothetical protein